MKQLVGYVTLGVPSFEFTRDLILAMSENGVDKIELGVPFSDPVADGVIITQANLKALRLGFTFSKLYELIKQIHSHIDVFVMGYANPFYRVGFEKVMQELSASHAKGLIIPDMPYEESIFYQSLTNQYHLSLIQFIAPTTPPNRIATLVQNTKEFIYLVAYVGITGKNQSENLQNSIQHIRNHSTTPIYLGFGVNAHNAKEKAQGVDGVIVGSAFVEILLNENLTNQEKISRICRLSLSIKESIN